MFALQVERGLFTSFYKTLCCVEYSNLCHTASNFQNEVNGADKKDNMILSAVQGNIGYKEYSQKIRSEMNLLKPLIKKSNDDTHGLSEAEMEILTDLVFDIVTNILQNSKPKEIHETKKHLEKVLTLTKPSLVNSIPLKHFESDFYSEKHTEKMTPKTLEFSFPLWNTLKDMTRDEALLHLKSKIPKDFNIGEDVVSSVHVLEKTSSNKLSASQKILLNNEDKLTLENCLDLHLRNYIQEKSPSDFPDPDLPKHLLGYWTSMKHIIRKITQVKGLNIEATHPVLQYTARADIVCSYEGQLVMMDWKTYIGLTNSSLSSNDYMAQTIACVGALNFDVNLSFQEPLHPVSLVIYPSGKPGHALRMRSAVVKYHWKEWLQRLSTFYRELNNQDTYDVENKQKFA